MPIDILRLLLFASVNRVCAMCILWLDDLWHVVYECGLRYKFLAAMVDFLFVCFLLLVHVVNALL